MKVSFDSKSSLKKPHGDGPYRELFTVLHKISRIDFTQYKAPTLRRAIQKRMSYLKIKSLPQYVDLIKKNDPETFLLANSMLIKVTCFFRDPETFKVLRRKIFPQLAKIKDVIRIWVPGCCTGQEVYSLAISLTEYLHQHQRNISLQIFGTDLSEEALQIARNGVYRPKDYESVPKEFQKYFKKNESGHYQIDKSIRSLCTFAKQNLIQDPPFSHIHLISCRNVLIYFSSEIQEKLSHILHYALADKGFLLLGKSENITTFSSALFSKADKLHSIFSKKSSAEHSVPSFGLTSKNFKETQPSIQALPPLKSFFDIGKEVDRVLMERSEQAAVLINDSYEILQTRGDVSDYLRIPPGKSTLNILKMARHDLGIELKMLLGRAERGLWPAQKTIAHNPQNISIEVLPLDTLSKEKNFLVLFNFSKKVSVPSHSASKRAQHLKNELASTKSFLKTIMEEHEFTVHELKSANEEILSSNEELQSLNEELQTAKEELESTNEEMATVNEELQNQMEALRQSEEKFRLLVESVKEYAIFILDPKGFILTWNPGAERIKGYSANEIIGQHFSKFYSKEDQKKPLMELEIAIKKGFYQEEGWRLRKDGSKFWASVVITALRDPKTGQLRGFAKVTRDLTERKKAEEALQQMNTALEQKVQERTQELQIYAEDLTRSNADLQQFAYIASHDLQEPLRMVSMYVDLLEERSKNQADDEIQKYMEYIRSGAVRAQQLIRELLEYSRIGTSGHPFMKISLNEVVKHVLSLLEVSIKESGTSVICGPLPKMTVDRFQMEQLFQNLILNAIKYRSDKKPVIEISAKKSGAYWTLQVKDNGIGIDPQYKEKIFIIFKRLHTSKEYPGTGIGLALCKKIVGNHGGKIWVESKPAKGASFFFTLPEKRKSS